MAEMADSNSPAQKRDGAFRLQNPAKLRE